MKRWLRHPALHFALLGSLIWLAVQYYQDWQFRVVNMPTAGEISQLEARWQQRNNQPLDDTVRAALLRQELDQRMLFREALRRKMHLRDPVVLMRLRQDAQFLGLQGSGSELVQSAVDLQLYQGDDVIRRRLLERVRSLASGSLENPSQEQLRSLLEAAETASPRLSFQQLFFRSEPQAPEQARLRAQQALALDDPRLARSDAFLHGDQFQALDMGAISKRFGRDFARTLNPKKTNQWQGPLASPYGWHLVFMQQTHNRTPEQRLKAQHKQLTGQWQQQQRHKNIADFLQRLRRHYRVVGR